MFQFVKLKKNNYRFFGGEVSVQRKKMNENVGSIINC